jgi:gas vesicle protein
MPMPSLAVSKVDHPMTGFGEATLLADPKLATPGRGNPVYRADAYTARQPSVDWTIDVKTRDATEKLVGPKKLGVDYQDVAKVILHEGDASSFPAGLKHAFLKAEKKRGISGVQVPKPPPNPLPGQHMGFSYEQGTSYLNKFKQWEKDVAESFHAYRNATAHPYPSPTPLLSFEKRLSSWVKGLKKRLLSAAGTKQRFRVGETPSGMRRYKEATLENLVTAMKKERGAGKEGVWGSSMGGIRAQVAPKFKTASQVRSARKSIVDAESFKKAKEEAEVGLKQFKQEVHDTLATYDEELGFGSHSATAEEVVTDLITTGRTWSGYGREIMDRLSGNMEQLRKSAKTVRKELQNLPTEYFEIKPERGVPLSEFKGAIVPEHTPKGVMQMLRDSGIKKILKYGTQEERTALFKKFPELFFGLSGVGLLNQETQQDAPPGQGLLAR